MSNLTMSAMNGLIPLLGGASAVAGGVLVLVGHGLIFGGRKAVHWSDSAINHQANPYKKLAAKVGGYSLIALGVGAGLTGADALFIGAILLGGPNSNLGKVGGACAAITVIYSLWRHVNA